MQRIAIIADTHIPSRESALPEWVVDELERADHTIHAGDFDSRQASDRIAALANRNLTAVRGNTDPPTIDAPRAATLEIGGVTFAVTHGAGSPTGWQQRVIETARAETAVAEPVAVAGHTHEVVDTTVDGIRLLNPGSATGAAPVDRATMYVATVEDGELTVELQSE
ncbi:metallophosphoesterase family protein [Natrinema versiforme]|uniref:Phosphoesterase n=1 Tax=Natrinema versiforme JCM 10478 TaxID=1227496 RepID=L9Y3S1_9EURY|nr:metallophosphoesterase [Natrinema versiforme]ELY68700.1 phosphodiesterase, MJ0936 family protein [Natrinema versiforme JCM 10478]